MRGHWAASIILSILILSVFTATDVSAQTIALEPANLLVVTQVDVTTSVRDDPNEHVLFVALASDITMEMGAAVNFPSASVIGTTTNIQLAASIESAFIGVSGTIDAQNNVVASGLGTAAGFSNVSADFTGIFDPVNNIVTSGVYILGANGALPESCACGTSAIEYNLVMLPNVPTSPVIISPVDGTTITTDTVTLTGTADIGNTIAVLDNNVSLGTIFADTNGNWTFTTSTLSDGEHSFTVTATVNAGNVSSVSNTVNLTIDTLPQSTFTEWTQAVIDLRATKSQAFQDTFPIGTAPEINRLLAWAGNPVAQANNSELQEFGHLYSIMKRWNERTDLQIAFEGADLAADPVNLVIWSGRANVLANSFNSDLVPHEPTYVLLRIFFLERDDLRDNPVFAGALDASDPKRLYCFAANSSDVRLTPHTQFYSDNCVL